MSLCSLLFNIWAPLHNRFLTDLSISEHLCGDTCVGKRQACLPYLWRSVFKADFEGFGPCSTIEPSPTIIIYSAPLEIPTSQGLLGYSPYWSRKDRSTIVGLVLIFMLLTNPCCKCLDRKTGTICMHGSLLIVWRRMWE